MYYNESKRMINTFEISEKCFIYWIIENLTITFSVFRRFKSVIACYKVISRYVSSF